jgi:hypothetical protein
MLEAKTVQDFLNVVLDLRAGPDEVSVYRGHADRDYNLIPHVFREPQFRDNEHLLLSEMIAAQPKEFAEDRSTLERLVRMQHYDLPTRLLDISHNPLVGLYFATDSKKVTAKNPPGSRYKTKQVEKDGQVVVLHVSKEIIKYFDSDTIACLTNIALLHPGHKARLASLTSAIDFNASLPVKRLVHFINAEKPGFLAEIEPSHLFNIYLVKPKQNNRRIVAQSGGFFAFGLTEKIDGSGMALIRVDRITIPGTTKAFIRTQLDRLGINEKSMFPELDRVARYVRESLQGGSHLTVT